jgi:hypothetical protein
VIGVVAEMLDREGTYDFQGYATASDQANLILYALFGATGKRLSDGERQE